MPSFSSVSELENFIESACKSAVIETENEIKSKILEQVNVYYDEYTPYAYIRTNALKRALRKKLDRNGLGFEVFFDNDKTNYQTGVKELRHTHDKDSPMYNMTGYGTWGSEQVFDTAVDKGLHGGYIKGTPIWKTGLENIGSIPELLKDKMIAEGLPIK